MAHNIPWIVLPFALTVFLVSYVPACSVSGSFTWTLVFSYFAVFIVRLFYSIILYPVFFTPFKNVPCAPGRSIWNGHARQLREHPAGAMLKKWTQEVPNDGLIRCYLFGNQERLLVTSPKALADVLIHKSYDWKKPELLNLSLKKITGEGVLLAEGDVHRAQRKHILPAFAYRHIKDLYPSFWDKGIEFVNEIEKAVKTTPHGNKVITFGDWVKRVNLDIIGVAGMGHDFGTVRDPDNLLSREYGKLFRDPPLLVRLLDVISAFTFPRLSECIPLEHNRVTQEASNTIRNFSRNLLQEKREKIKSRKSDGDSDVDIISTALESGGFTDESLVDQVMTFLAAGHETTSTAMQFAIYALCKHPDMQERLRTEVRSNLPSISSPATPSTITATMIDSLPYLNAFCSETLRFHPPVPVSIREAARDTSILDTFIPRGTRIAISAFATNRNPDLWGLDADVFNPDRWLGSGKAKMGGSESSYALLTFSHGPRSCVGSAFTRSEMACLVALLVGKFEFELEDPEKEMQLKLGVTTSPVDGIRTRVKVLEGW